MKSQGAFPSANAIYNCQTSIYASIAAMYRGNQCGLTAKHIGRIGMFESLARRSLAAAVAMLAFCAAPTPADAQDKKVRAQLAGAFPSTMAILGSAQARFIQMATEMSHGSIDIKFFEPGALMPGSQYPKP